MKSLFLRIFLSFWMAQALFVVLAILVTLAFRPRGSSWEPLRTTSLNEAVSSLRSGWTAAGSGISGKLTGDAACPRLPFQRAGRGGFAPGRAGLGNARAGQRVSFSAGRIYYSGSQGVEGIAGIVGWIASLHAGHGTSSGAACVSGAEGNADSGIDYRSDYFRIGVLSAGVVFDAADCAAAGGNAATGGGRSDGAQRRLPQASGGTKSQGWYATLTPWRNGWRCW